MKRSLDEIEIIEEHTHLNIQVSKRVVKRRTYRADYSDTEQKEKNNFTALKHVTKFKIRENGLVLILDTPSLNTFSIFESGNREIEGIPESQIVIIEKDKKTYNKILQQRRLGGYKFRMYCGEVAEFIQKFDELYPSNYIASAYLDFCGSMIGDPDSQGKTDPITVLRLLTEKCLWKIPVVITVSNIGCRGRKQTSQLRKPKNRKRLYSKKLPNVWVEQTGYRNHNGCKIYKAQCQMSIEKLEICPIL